MRTPFLVELRQFSPLKPHTVKPKPWCCLCV